MIRSNAPIIATDDLLREYERTGCAQTFERIVAEHRPYVLAICSRITGNAHDAEDGTQAVFLTLSLQARGGNNIHSLRPWLAQVARHVSLDLCKARKRRQNHEQAAMRGEVQADGRSAVDEKELQQLIKSQIESLPPRYRTPMILFYFGGMSLPQIGQQLGVNRKALSVRLLRARRMLAQSLSQSQYPWFSVAAAPLLIEEVIRTGMWDMSSAASVPGGRLVASLTPSFFNFNFPLKIKRNIGLAAIALAGFASVAGSASVGWFHSEDKIKLELPSFSDWLGKKLSNFTNINVPMRVQETPVAPKKNDSPVVSNYHPRIIFAPRTAPINLPPPQQIAQAPKVFKGPSIDLQIQSPSLHNQIVNGNISTSANANRPATAKARASTNDLPQIASANNHTNASPHHASASGSAVTNSQIASSNDSTSNQTETSTVRTGATVNTASVAGASYTDSNNSYLSLSPSYVLDSSGMSDKLSAEDDQITGEIPTDIYDLGTKWHSLIQYQTIISGDVTEVRSIPTTHNLVSPRRVMSSENTGLPEPGILSLIGVSAVILGKRQRRRG